MTPAGPRANQRAMSGHNKWSTIKHRKGAQDAKRGKVFSDDVSAALDEG